MSEVDEIYDKFYEHERSCLKCINSLPVGQPADDCEEGQKLYEPIGQYEAENDI